MQSMTRSRIFAALTLVASSAVFIAACSASSGSNDSFDQGQGGASGQGGAQNNGGSLSTPDGSVADASDDVSSDVAVDQGDNTDSSLQNDSNATGQGGADDDSGNDSSQATGGSQGDDASLDSPFTVPEASADAVSEVPINVCDTQCGPTELCDPDHIGFDDNCNGVVDEGCSCTPGQSHWCFKGDPAARGKGACKDGVEKCNELGHWGACVGGNHADGVDNCLNQGVDACHDLTEPPFTTVNLEDGTGTFSQGASSTNFSVACPAGIPASSCPAVQNANSTNASFTPVQSGQYTVTYTRDNPDGGAPTSCTFSIYVGTSGLRVELNWDNQGKASSGGPDIDLHVHQPGSKTPWFDSLNSNPTDCYYSDCKANSYSGSSGPSWFSDNAYPHNWTYKTPYDPSDPAYTCYNAPRGAGADWKNIGKGCHNPRLDLDNITCNNTVTDPQNASFCAPENINIDEPPLNQWTRIGVHYYGSCYSSGSVHPTVTIYCGASQAGQFGSAGFNAPVTFSSSQCVSSGNDSNAFWLVADVMVTQDQCGRVNCLVQPLYGNATTKTPLITTASGVKSSFGPDYPAITVTDGGVGDQ